MLGLGHGPDGRRRLNAGRIVLVSAVSLGLTAALAWGLWRIVDDEVAARVVGGLGSRPELLVAFVATYFAAFALRAEAWRWLLSDGHRFGPLLGIVHLSLFANHVLPLKPGDVLRGFLLFRRGAPGAEAGVSTVAARLLDLVGLVVLVVVLAPVVTGGADAALPVAVAAVFVAALVVGLVALPRIAETRLAARLPAAGRRLVHSVSGAVAAIPRGRALAALVLLVLPSWVLEAGVLWAVSEAAGLDLPVTTCIGVTAFTILLQSIQLVPGNLGVYEATMTGALVATGVPAGEAFAVAAATHALKFAYSFAAGAIVLGGTGVRHGMRWLRDRGRVAASRVEIVAARAWNVLNEGKPFTVVFSFAVFVGTAVTVGISGVSLSRLPGAVLLTAPLFLVFYRYDFPLRLRAALWAFVGVYLVWFRAVFPVLVAVELASYLFFTVVLWGSVYYHLRIGTPLTNFRRFWRLVLENPDTTSANFLEQIPKVFLLTHVLALGAGGGAGAGGSLGILLFTALVGLTSVLVHQWFFTWRPRLPVHPAPPIPVAPARARRFLLIVIDGCRLDRLGEARTPVLDRLASEGLRCTAMQTVYPARTVTGFSSMLTGAPPRVHGMRSNFVPRLGVRCESVFTALRGAGKHGRLVGIAHLVDAFGGDVRAVTAVQDNDRIDRSLLEEAKRELLEHDPDLLVLQLLSVDQTGHARGSYREEYLEKVEATDALIGEFLTWAEREGFLEGATVAVTSDHGQGKGVGGHGHLGPGERFVPFVMWGSGVPAGAVVEEPRSLVDVAPTICRALGVASPDRSVGRSLIDPPETGRARALAVVVPAHNEHENLPEVLAAIPRDLGPLEVLVVDDASTDDTAALARAHGATVVSLGWRRGLGAALRAGLEAAAELDPWAAVYLDADGEYDPREIPRLLEPIRQGRADYVLGSRFAGSIEGMTRTKRIANRGFTGLTSVLAGRRISDGQTGFRAFSAEALAVAEIVHDYNYAQVLTLDLLGKGLRLEEVPITYRRRRHGRSFVSAAYLWRVPTGIARELVSD
jgi:uncharacterized protein (TIRG00374 family)